MVSYCPGWLFVDCLGAVASIWDSHTVDLSSIPIWLLHHGNKRGRHSANHNLLPDMHLHVPVLHVTTCLTLSLFKIKSCERYISYLCIVYIHPL